MAGALDGKVALVTGAGSGIGAATAQLFAREGARVAAVIHHESEVEQATAAIRAAGGQVLPLVADVGDAAQMEQVAAKTVQTWGRLDVVFANAGINGVWAPIEELAPEEWERTLRTNLSGTFYTIKYAAPFLKKQGGAVVITASINGTRVFSNTGATAYSATKAGQVAVAKMLALELAPYHVRVNAVCPGGIRTDIEQNTVHRDLSAVDYPVEYPKGEIPLTGGQPGSAEQVAQLVLFLASDAASHITGTEVWIDGAQSLLIG